MDEAERRLVEGLKSTMNILVSSSISLIHMLYSSTHFLYEMCYFTYI